MLGLLRQLYTDLRLRINESKSAVDLARNRKLLGYSFWLAPGRVVKRRVASKAIATMKERVRTLTRRTVGRSMVQVCAGLRSYLLGWKQYFRLADTPAILAALDEWIRHRLRAIHLKQWKRGTTIYRELRARGLGRQSRDGGAQRSPLVEKLGKAYQLGLPTCYFDNPACRGLPRDLNSTNRPVRPRMPGGVAGT